MKKTKKFTLLEIRDNSLFENFVSTGCWALLGMKVTKNIMFWEEPLTRSIIFEYE